MTPDKATGLQLKKIPLKHLKKDLHQTFHKIVM